MKLDDVAPLHFQAPGIRSDKKTGDFDYEEWLPILAEMQRLKEKASYSQYELTLELGDGTRPIAIAGFSDTHIGSWTTDHNLFDAITKQLIEIPDLYIGLLGDMGEYAIKLRGVSEVANQILPPNLQTEFFISWLKKVQNKVAFCTWDNHAVERQERNAGESQFAFLAGRRVAYLKGIGHIQLKVGSQTYAGAVSHVFRGRSFLNPLHSQMRYMRFEGVDREWCMAGDTHVPGMSKYTDGKVIRVAVNMGSTHTMSTYAKRHFSLYTHPVFPLLVFWPDRHEITPVWSVREYLDLRSLSPIARKRTQS